MPERIAWVGALLLLVSLSAAAADSALIERADGKMMARTLASPAEAVEQGCLLAHLKDADSLAAMCDVEGFHDHQLLIFERGAGSTLVLAHEWCGGGWYGGWYGMGGSRLVQLFDDGRDQIRIDALGNTGTGTLQEFRTYLGWCGGAWRVLFLETTSYRVGSDLDRHLVEKFRWEGVRSASPAVTVIVTQEERQAGPAERFPYWLSGGWTDHLTWHPEACSFYDRAMESDRVRRGWPPGQAAVGRLRLLTIGADADWPCNLGPSADGIDSEAWNALTSVLGMYPRDDHDDPTP